MELETLVRLVFFAVSLVIIVLVAVPVYAAVFGGPGFDLEQLAQRIEFISCSDGGSLLNQNCFSDKPFTTVFSIQAEQHDLLLFFEEPGGTLEIVLGRDQPVIGTPFGSAQAERTLIFTNPYDSAPAVCRLAGKSSRIGDENALRRRDCVRLVQEGNERLRISSLPSLSHWIVDAQTRSLYPQPEFSITEIRYPEFPMAQRLPPAIYFPEEEVFTLYIEYAPPHENYPYPRLLVAIHDRDEPHFTHRRDTFRYGSNSDLERLVSQVNDMIERVADGSEYESRVVNLLAEPDRMIMIFGQAGEVLGTSGSGGGSVFEVRRQSRVTGPVTNTSNPVRIINPCWGPCICSYTVDALFAQPPIMDVSTCYEFASSMQVSSHTQVTQVSDISAGQNLYRAIGTTSANIAYPEFLHNANEARVYPALYVFRQRAPVDTFIEVAPPISDDRLPRVLIQPMTATADTYRHLDMRREAFVQ